MYTKKSEAEGWVEMLKERLNFGKKDNRGISLVELLVAFAIGAVVLSGVAYMLFTSLRISGKNNAGVEVQSEVQASLNLVLDQIMMADGIGMKISPSGGNTSCILLGETDMRKTGSGYEMYYRGNAVILADESGGRKALYMAEFPNEVYGKEADGYCRLSAASDEIECIKAGIANTEQYITNLTAEQRIRWLLGRDITSFQITPQFVYGEKTVKENGVDVVKQLYEAPAAFTVTLTVEKDYGDGAVTRTIHDKAAVRNRLKKIYLTKPGEAENNLEAYEREQ